MATHSFDVKRFTTQTTNATPANIAAVTVPLSSVVLVLAFVIAKKTGVDDSAVFVRVAGFMRHSSGDAAGVGSQTALHSGDAIGSLACILKLSEAIGPTEWLLEVTGAASTTIDWDAFAFVFTLTP